MSAIEGQEAKKKKLTTRIWGPEMLLRYCLLSLEHGREMWDSFCGAGYLREVQQQDCVCVCRQEREETE